MVGTKISVAMAAYNGENFLQEQLDSLARQTLLPFELVVCDDGSDDDTLNILTRFARSAPFAVHVHRNTTRLGAGFNFMNALGRCSGDLVAFCDQDDLWQESKLEVCAAAMRDPEAALVSHSAAVLTSLPTDRHWRRPDHKPQVWRSCKDFTVYRWQLLGFSIVMRRKLLEQAHLPAYRADFSQWCAHDVWATAAALSGGKVVLLAEELAFYRLHEKNTTLRPRDKLANRAQPNPATYELGAQQFTGLAEFLRYSASFCEESTRHSFYDLAAQADRTSALCSDRAHLHRALGRPVAAMKRLGSMAAKGHYGPQGMGARAFVRDALLAAFSLRSQK